MPDQEAVSLVPKKSIMKAISKKQAQNIDKIAQDKFGITTLVLMENAGRSTAELASDMLGNAGRIAIFCGKGNNGGDGFAAARHLLSKGIDIDVYLAARYNDVKNDAKVNLNILLALGLSVDELVSTVSLREINFAGYSLIIDAIFGIGLSGKINGIAEDVIGYINNARASVLSVDIPSGLDADSGATPGICVEADKTITFVASKTGMLNTNSSSYCGEIVIRDIGFPAHALDVLPL